MRTLYYFCPGCRQTIKRVLPIDRKLMMSYCATTNRLERMRKSRAKNPAKLVGKP